MENATTSKSVKPDRRRARTLRSLFSAFRGMVGKISLDELTIGALTEAADINRVTFYAHFANLEVFIDEAVRLAVEEAAETMAAPFVAAPDDAGVDAPIVAFLNAFSERRDFFVWIGKSSRGTKLEALLYGSLREVFKKRIALLKPACPKLRGDLYISYNAAGAARLLSDIVLAGADPEAAREAVSLFRRIWLPSAYAVLGIGREDGD